MIRRELNPPAKRYGNFGNRAPLGAGLPSIATTSRDSANTKPTRSSSRDRWTPVKIDSTTLSLRIFPDSNAVDVTLSLQTKSGNISRKSFTFWLTAPRTSFNDCADDDE